MKCPACGSARVYPSRLRNLLERLRQTMTDRQPFRCHQCGWRRWREMHVHPENPDVHPDDLRTGRSPAPIASSDIDRLDAIAARPAANGRPVEAGS
jgi:hypothetical protein